MRYDVSYENQEAYTPEITAQGIAENIEFLDAGGSYNPEYIEDPETDVRYKDIFKGRDGISPTVSVNKVGRVTTITITDANGEHVATIEDGSVADVPIDNDTIVIRNGQLAVNTVNTAEQDNSRPISSAGVQMIVGNIDVLLRGI